MKKNLPWDEYRLGELISLKTGKQDVNAGSQDGAFPFFTCSRETLRIDWAEFSGPSVIVAGNGDLNVKYFDGAFNAYQRTYVLQSVDQRLDISYLYAFLVKHVALLRSETQGSTIQYLKKDQFTEAVIPLPSISEQKAIASALSDADALVESLDALITKKRDMKQGAIQQLLTGRTRLGGAETPWKSQKIGDLFSFKRTTALSRAQLSVDGPCGYVHYGDIHSRWGTHLDLSQEVLPRCSHELSGSASYLEEGDLIMADASEDLEGVGRMVEVRNIGAQNAIAGLHTVLLRPAKGIFAPGFAGFISLVPDFVSQARTLAAGLKVYGLSKSALASIEVRVPDIKEQQLISAVLLDMDAEIDALVAQREKAELVKQGMMQELLSGRVRLV